MKIVTASGKKTLAMTHEDWTKIGEKAGWLGKKACQCVKTEKVEAEKDEKKLPDFLKKKVEEKKADEKKASAPAETKVAATEKKPAAPAAAPEAKPVPAAAPAAPATPATEPKKA